MKKIKIYKSDNEKMLVALKEAEKAFNKNEVPIGAAAFYNNSLIAKDYNKVIKFNNTMAHSEILVLKKCSKKFNNFRLNNIELFTTIEPCIMCFGALIHSRIKRLVYGANNPKFGFTKFIKNINLLNHKIEIKKNILHKECTQILKEFFKNKR
ncbi:MAG TPA: nucleoside deaminase [bacterium]|nr:nucleoside deaminase [bacterium]